MPACGVTRTVETNGPCGCSVPGCATGAMPPGPPSASSPRVAGVDQAHICRIERGQRRPSGIPLARLVIALDWLSTGQGRGGPWSRLDAATPSPAARWGEGRPPAVVGREPPTASAFPDPGHVLDVLLGPLPPADAIADSGPGLSTEPVVRPAA